MSTSRTSICLRLSDDLANAYKELAGELEQSVNSAIRQAMIEYLNKHREARRVQS